MDGSPPGGRVLTLDHDRLFKELLTTFFFEFLDLFFPELAAQVDRDSIGHFDIGFVAGQTLSEETRIESVLRARVTAVTAASVE